MKIETVKMAIILLPLPLTAFAGGKNEYHYDATAFYSREEVDTLDINGWSASFEYYWNPVTYSDLCPNKEAVFIIPPWFYRGKILRAELSYQGF